MSSQDTVSRACAQAGNKNAHCQTVLKQELAVIEKEKTRLMQNINHEAKQFRERMADHGHSPALRAASASKSRTTSARGSRQGSATRSPRASPSRASSAVSKHNALLPRRQSSAGTGSGSPEVQRKESVTYEQVFVTALGTKALLLPANESDIPVGVTSSSQHRSSPRHLAGEVPQIVVSNDAGPPSEPNLQRRGSLQMASGPGSPRSGSDSGSEHGHPLTQSLNIPFQRPRSNSMPVVALPANFLRSVSSKRRASVCPEPEVSELLVPESPRNRSTSFSGIVPVRRRGSISERWGSISERNRPVIGSQRGRRGSVDLKNMLRDLNYGVQHKELMTLDSRTSVSDKMWEELKQCRYLRIPSRDNSEEDVSQPHL